MTNRQRGILSMDKQDEQNFNVALSSCCEIIGKPKLSQAAAKLLFNKLSLYPLDWVIWGMTEATDQCSTGFDFNIRLVRETIEKGQKKNEFRENAILKLNQQEQAAIEQEKYIESEEYKNNQAAAEKCIKEMKEAIKNGI